jgi:hypothetical protein
VAVGTAAGTVEKVSEAEKSVKQIKRAELVASAAIQNIGAGKNGSCFRLAGKTR